MYFIWEEKGSSILSLLVYLHEHMWLMRLVQWGRHRHLEPMGTGQSENVPTWGEEGKDKPRSHWSRLSIA